jgi:hypothetical protein
MWVASSSAEYITDGDTVQPIGHKKLIMKGENKSQYGWIFVAV